MRVNANAVLRSWTSLPPSAAHMLLSICTRSIKERKIFFGVCLEILLMLNHEKEEKHPLPRQAKLHVCPLMILKEINPRKSENPR